ncbi:MAG: transposase [Cellvibrionaceae bacterium]|nr:transposase [Cellvibrionaceae bacterium]
MSNHLHIVAKLTPSPIDALSQKEVAQRWSCLFKGTILFQRWLNSDALDQMQSQAVADEIEKYRGRLSDLGWFMKCLNEPIARQANKEDGCTGHFWQARYKSQALLTEEAILSAMAYVDLNPIRAGMASTPETSHHTSIKERIAPSFDLTEAVREQIARESLLKFDLPLQPLAKFEGSFNNAEQASIRFALDDYLALVDYTGRYVRDNKRGAIATHLPPILQRLNIDRKTWLNNATGFEKNYQTRFSRRARCLQKTA